MSLVYCLFGWISFILIDQWFIWSIGWLVEQLCSFLLDQLIDVDCHFLDVCSSWCILQWTWSTKNSWPLWGSIYQGEIEKHVPMDGSNHKPFASKIAYAWVSTPPVIRVHKETSLWLIAPRLLLVTYSKSCPQLPAGTWLLLRWSRCTGEVETPGRKWFITII